MSSRMLTSVLRALAWVAASGLCLPTALAVLCPDKGGGGGSGGGPATDPAIVVNDNGSIVVMNPNGTSPTLVLASVEGFGVMQPHFTPDGTQIIFNGSAGAGPGIYVVNVNGTGLTFILPLVSLFDGGPVVSPAASPDGQVKIAFADDTPDGFSDLFLVNLDGTGLVNLTHSALRAEWQPTWSPQGDALCAVMISSDETTLFEDCYVYELGVVSGGVAVTNAFSLVNVAGSPLRADLSEFRYPDWARTRDKILLSVDLVGLATGRDLWAIDLANLLNPVNLTGDSTNDESSGSWSPDDAKIIYRFFGLRKNTGIYSMNANGSSRTKLSSIGKYPDRRRS